MAQSSRPPVPSHLAPLLAEEPLFFLAGVTFSGELSFSTHTTSTPASPLFLFLVLNPSLHVRPLLFCFFMCPG